MKKPHKHAELIKAWANGAEIEYYDNRPREHRWISCGEYTPSWDARSEYRIKPDPKPDVVRFVSYEWNPENQNTIGGIPSNSQSWHSNLKLIFDGETGKLKSAEVL